MIKKKICWITGSNFLDVDLPIIPNLLDTFDIQWYIFRQKESWFSVEYCKKIIERIGCKGGVLCLNNRLVSIESFMKFKELVLIMRKSKADIYYVNYIGVPFLWPLIFLSGIQLDKIVYPCHDFKDHVGVPNRRYYVVTKRLIFKFITNFQFFSITQRKLFLLEYKRKNVFYAPLALKDFGGEKKQLFDSNTMVFLFFGNIRENKGMHILIEAANMLYEKYPGKFIVKIAGNCSNWRVYSDKIKYRECFELDIRRIENEEISGLFHSAHYLILPYEDVTQSGPLLISYNYYLPVIASDHDGFKEYIQDNKTGFLFKNLDAVDLCKTMEKAICMKEDYLIIKQNLEVFVDENCTLESIVRKYKIGFNQIIK